MNLRLSNPTLAVVAGLVVPYVLAVVRQPKMSERFMAFLAIAASVVAAYCVARHDGQVDKANLLGTALAVLGVSQGFYKSVGPYLGLPELDQVTTLSVPPRLRAVLQALKTGTAPVHTPVVSTTLLPVAVPAAPAVVPVSPVATPDLMPVVDLTVPLTAQPGSDGQLHLT